MLSHVFICVAFSLLCLCPSSTTCCGDATDSLWYWSFSVVHNPVGAGTKRRSSASSAVSSSSPGVPPSRPIGACGAGWVGCCCRSSSGDRWRRGAVDCVEGWSGGSCRRQLTVGWRCSTAGGTVAAGPCSRSQRGGWTSGRTCRGCRSTPGRGSSCSHR